MLEIMATIELHGDPRERKYWPVVKNFFPLYEPFWSQHIVPLRGPDGGISPEAHESLEFLAQKHYSCFISLRLAHKELGNERHPEKAFSHLQNAANRARDTATRFNEGNYSLD